MVVVEYWSRPRPGASALRERPESTLRIVQKMNVFFAHSYAVVAEFERVEFVIFACKTKLAYSTFGGHEAAFFARLIIAPVSRL